MRSMPGSRSGSPPITLPPLKVPQNVADDERGSEKSEDDIKVKKEDEDVGMEVDKRSRKGKVELPGFSEFEAAARGLVSPPSSQKMSIDFVR